MTLVACEECGKRISDRAKSCPHCGYTHKKNRKKIAKWTLLVFLFVFLISLTCFVIFWRDGEILARASYYYINRQYYLEKRSRDAVIKEMADLNLRTETLDKDDYKVVELLNESQLNLNALRALKSIPILIQGSPEILKECGNNTSGCLKNGKIYIKQIDGSQVRTHGVVTYDHEALHVLYEILPDNVRDEINPMLESTYRNITDKSFLEDMKLYDKKDKELILRELHSKIGTEINSSSYDMGTELSEYYDKYFYDRNAIVSANRKVLETLDGLESSCKYGLKLNWRDPCDEYNNLLTSIKAIKGITTWETK